MSTTQVAVQSRGPGNTHREGTHPILGGLQKKNLGASGQQTVAGQRSVAISVLLFVAYCPVRPGGRPGVGGHCPVRPGVGGHCPAGSTWPRQKPRQAQVAAGRQRDRGGGGVLSVP